MIPLLPRWNLMPNRPSFYETDSKTLLELASVLHSSMNQLITDYNAFVDSTNQAITEFTEQTTENQENFKVGMRQEFQDFINVIDLKIQDMNRDFENFTQGVNNGYAEFTSQVNTRLSNMDGRINGMIENQIPITQDIINGAIQEGTLTIIETYDEETESLNMVVTGGV